MPFHDALPKEPPIFLIPFIFFRFHTRHKPLDFYQQQGLSNLVFLPTRVLDLSVESFWLKLSVAYNG
jgi:hypothetical protein